MQDNATLNTRKTLNFRGRLVDLRIPRVMGILNVTPDSFYYGSRVSPNDAVEVAGTMLREGADFIDIGGYSSRPGAADIALEEEISRTVPVIKALKKAFPNALISVDTFRSEVARQTLEAGADFINDISGGSLDAKMFKVVAQANVPYVLMHMRGTPQTMKQLTNYSDLLHDVTQYFYEKVDAAHQAGVQDILLDPGFGFAKTAQQSYHLLRHLNQLQIFGLPLVAGLSRKSMIWNTLQIAPDEALNGTTALNMIALQQGATILRVHDVVEARQCIELHRQLFSS
jgi:dihydropteroate synthase